MNGKIGKLARVLCVAAATIMCELPVRANPAGDEAAPNGNISYCNGAAPAQIPYPFADYYSCVGLGAVPGVPTSYGGLTFKYDDPNTLLIGGTANDSSGRIYQIAVIRDATRHIVGFSGTAKLYPASTSRIGQYNDGGVTFGPDNVLFVTRYPGNQLEQTIPGRTTPSKVVDLAPFGVTASVGSVAFVPPGFPGAGSMKLVTYPSGDWYNVDFVPDGTGTFALNLASRQANVGAAEGIAFVPPASPGFSPNSVLIANYAKNRITTAPLDYKGDPIIANQREFLNGLVGPEGATVDPVTGDVLFSTSGTENKVIIVRGFAVPSTSPIPAPSPCQYRVAIIFSDPNGAPTKIRDEIQADPDVAAVALLNGALGPPGPGQLLDYDIVIVLSNDAYASAAILGDRLAEYVDAGGVVVQCAYSFLGGAVAPEGRWVSGNYSPFNYAITSRAGQFGGRVDDRAHPLMGGVTTLNFSSLQTPPRAAGTITVASAT
ncbi:MAG TPA: hypothetical protein VF511_04510, partial [Chthoniobacterales bacterium]